MQPARTRCIFSAPGRSSTSQFNQLGLSGSIAEVLQPEKTKTAVNSSYAERDAKELITHGTCLERRVFSLPETKTAYSETWRPLVRTLWEVRRIATLPQNNNHKRGIIMRWADESSQEADLCEIQKVTKIDDEIQEVVKQLLTSQDRHPEQVTTITVTAPGLREEVHTIIDVAERQIKISLKEYGRELQGMLQLLWWVRSHHRFDCSFHARERPMTFLRIQWAIQFRTFWIFTMTSCRIIL